MILLQKSSIPCGSNGVWAVENFVVSKDEAQVDALRASINGSRRCTPAGKYTKLVRNNVLVMSDTPDEIRDNAHAIRKAHSLGGFVLINGLGLGLTVKGILKSKKVKKVTVIEISPEVINLVGTHLLKEFPERLEIVNANAFDYKPKKGDKFSVVWHDIWDYICSANKPEMTKLKRKYARRCEWQGCWSEHFMYKWG